MMATVAATTSQTRKYRNRPNMVPRSSLKSPSGFHTVSGNMTVAARKMKGGTILTTNGIGTHTVRSRAVVEYAAAASRWTQAKRTANNHGWARNEA